MSFSGLSFMFWRILQIITLIPIVGMLAWFVDFFNDRNLLTPRSILILFIVATLAAAWTVGTLFLYAKARHSANFVAFVDLLFVGALIGAVYELRGIASADCSDWVRSGTYSADFGIVQISGSSFRLDVNSRCAMLKASFALAIMNIIFFFITMLLALLVHRNHVEDRVVVKREVHRSRHGHRSRSPRHSHHSHRSRSYV